MTDCKDHKGCSTTEFVGVWDCSDSIAKCKSATSEKNNEESPVHIILSEDGKTAITYSYLLYDENGISENLLVKNLTTFSFYNTQFALAVSKK